MFYIQYLRKYHYRKSRTDYYRHDGEEVYGIERYNHIAGALERMTAFNEHMVQQVPTLKLLSQQKIIESVHVNKFHTASVFNPETEEFDLYIKSSSAKIDKDVYNITWLTQIPLKERKQLINLRIYCDAAFKSYGLQLVAENVGFEFAFWYHFLYWTRFFIEGVPPGDYNYYYTDMYYRLCIEQTGHWDHADTYYVLCKRNLVFNNWVGIFHTNFEGFETYGEIVQDPVDMNLRLNQLGLRVIGWHTNFLTPAMDPVYCKIDILLKELMLKLPIPELYQYNEMEETGDMAMVMNELKNDFVEGMESIHKSEVPYQFRRMNPERRVCYHTLCWRVMEDFRAILDNIIGREFEETLDAFLLPYSKNWLMIAVMSNANLHLITPEVYKYCWNLLVYEFLPSVRYSILPDL